MRKFIVIVALIAASRVYVRADESRQKPTSVSAAGLNNGSVIVTGRLGKPLGTPLEVEGCATAEAKAEQNSLVIDARGVVDPANDDVGLFALGFCPTLEVRGLKVQAEKRYYLRGYELGEFLTREDRALPAQFHSYFVVTKVLGLVAEPKPVSVADMKITFAKDRVEPPEGAPKESRHAGITPEPNAQKNPGAQIAFGEVKDPADHGPLSTLVDGNIASLRVTWMDPERFKTEAAAADFLRTQLPNLDGHTYTFEIWSHGLQTPMITADVEHVVGKPGKLLVWPNGPERALLVYLDCTGKWWFGDWTLRAEK